MESELGCGFPEQRRKGLVHMQQKGDGSSISDDYNVRQTAHYTTHTMLESSDNPTNFDDTSSPCCHDMVIKKIWKLVRSTKLPERG